jgi:hypothetical protein
VPIWTARGLAHILNSSYEETPMPQPHKPRTGGQILVDQLSAQGVEHIFCVPGESYLAVTKHLYFYIVTKMTWVMVQ